MNQEKELKEPLVEKEAQKVALKPVSFFSLLRFADKLDKTFMIVGTLAAMGAGAAMPFFMIFFGQISTIFIDGNQEHAVEQSLEIMVKFFILGGATWFLSKFEDNVDEFMQLGS